MKYKYIPLHYIYNIPFILNVYASSSAIKNLMSKPENNIRTLNLYCEHLTVSHRPKSYQQVRLFYFYFLDRWSGKESVNFY